MKAIAGGVVMGLLGITITVLVLLTYSLRDPEQVEVVTRDACLQPEGITFMLKSRMPGYTIVRVVPQEQNKKGEKK